MQLYQIFRKNIGEKFWNLGLGKEFIDVTPKEQFIKGKIEKLDLIKVKNICFVKDPMKKMKR